MKTKTKKQKKVNLPKPREQFITDCLKLQKLLLVDQSNIKGGWL